MSQPIKVLVFLVGTIGDTLVTIPALRIIRKHYSSGCHITLMHETHANRSYTPQDILNGQDLVDGYFTYNCPVNNWDRLSIGFDTLRRLRRLKFDVVVYLIAQCYRTKARVMRDKIFFSQIGVKNLFCFYHYDIVSCYPIYTTGSLKPVMQQARYLLNLLSKAGFNTGSEDSLLVPNLYIPITVELEVDEWLQKHNIDPGCDLIGICPGAKKQVCTWPLERFEALARRIGKTYRVNIIAIGGGAEMQAGERVARAAGSGLNACGALSALGSASLLKRCKFMVGLDTGTAHLAAAVGTRCVLVFSAQDWPGRWSPLGMGHKLIRRTVPCEGCRRDQCNVTGHPCMLGISVDDVWAAIITVSMELNCMKRSGTVE